MRPEPLVVIALLALAGAADAHAAPSERAELCALAMKNRPVDRLQSGGSCRIERSEALPKGSALERAVILRVPLATGTVDILMLRVRESAVASWHDLGPVAGETRATAPGDPLEIRDRQTLDALKVRDQSGGPVLELSVSSVRTMDDRKGISEVKAHAFIFCRHERGLICARVPDRVALTVRGDVDDDLEPYSWTRSVQWSPKGAIVITAREGSGEPSVFDPGPGSHSLESLKESPFVRIYPVVPDVHPDAQSDEDPLDLPASAP